MSVFFATPSAKFGHSNRISCDLDSSKRFLQFKIAELDELISTQLNAILHTPNFQALESSWRGLWRLVGCVENPKITIIRLLDVSWKELARDIERAPDFDQSGLFHLVYNQEFGTPGGEPFSVLLGDYYVAHKPSELGVDDVFTLQGISRAAAAAFCPFVCAASPILLGLDDFDHLGLHSNVDEIFKAKEYIRWNSLRDQEDSRFLVLTLPQVLMRAPYDADRYSTLGFSFKEECSYKNNSRYLWGNSCFALGSVLIREFTNVGWFSHIRGAPRDLIGGGVVAGFPSLPYIEDDSRSDFKPFTSVIITDHFETHLNEHGLMALCQSYKTTFAVFNSSPSLQRPKKYKEKSATANAKISSSVQQILCGSRIAQYIKVIVRDMVGSYTTAVACERYLQGWLDQYTSGRDDLSWEMMARYPLREAQVRIFEEPGKPGHFSSVIHLKTHYSADNLVSELKLTTALSQTDIGRV